MNISTSWQTRPRLGASRPAPGSNWSANFYKCGGTKPHYGAWSALKAKRPGQMGAFHSPESFAPIEFAGSSL